MDFCNIFKHELTCLNQIKYLINENDSTACILPLHSFEEYKKEKLLPIAVFIVCTFQADVHI